MRNHHLCVPIFIHRYIYIYIYVFVCYEYMYIHYRTPTCRHLITLVYTYLHTICTNNHAFAVPWLGVMPRLVSKSFSSRATRYIRCRPSPSPTVNIYNMPTYLHTYVEAPIHELHHLADDHAEVEPRAVASGMVIFSPGICFNAVDFPSCSSHFQ